MQLQCNLPVPLKNKKVSVTPPSPQLVINSNRTTTIYLSKNWVNIVFAVSVWLWIVKYLLSVVNLSLDCNGINIIIMYEERVLYNALGSVCGGSLLLVWIRIERINHQNQLYPNKPINRCGCRVQLSFRQLLFVVGAGIDDSVARFVGKSNGRWLEIKWVRWGGAFLWCSDNAWRFCARSFWRG